MKQEEILELIIKSLPYPEQIQDIDLSHENSVYFVWRGNKFKVSDTLLVDEVEGCILSGTDLSIVLRQLLKNTIEFNRIYDT